MDLKDRVQSFVGHLLDIDDWKEWYMDIETIILHPSYDEQGNMIQFHSFQYKLLYTILNNIEVCEEPVLRKKKIFQCAVKFEAGEENRIVYESLFCFFLNFDGSLIVLF